jgi:hypothetical protein
LSTLIASNWNDPSFGGGLTTNVDTVKTAGSIAVGL